MMSKCQCCDGTLTAQQDRKRGIHRECVNDIINGGGYTSSQISKAMATLVERAICKAHKITSKGHTVFRVVSSDGSQQYLTTYSACTCKAGTHGKRCCHRLAAILF